MRESLQAKNAQMSFLSHISDFQSERELERLSLKPTWKKLPAFAFWKPNWFQFHFKQHNHAAVIPFYLNFRETAFVIYFFILPKVIL